MIDVVISFDDTGSMQSVRKQVRANINELVNTLFDTVKGIRIGIIIQYDYCDPQPVYILDLSDNKEKIIEFINSPVRGHGGDSPECYELCLNKANNVFSWKQDRKSFILIGDDIPHGVGYTFDSKLINRIDWQNECKALYEKGIQIYAVQCLNKKYANFFYDTIAKLTSGYKLHLNQFAHINVYLQAIINHQLGDDYLEKYEQTDNSFKTNVSLKNMFAQLKQNINWETSPSSVPLNSNKDILSKFQIMEVLNDGQSIKDFVIENGCTFSPGKGFYQLVSTVNGKANSEKLQNNKQVIFVEKETGIPISDTEWCREQLGIPFGTSGTLRPKSFPELMDKYDIFIQSTSYTRKLDKNTKFLYEGEYT